MALRINDSFRKRLRFDAGLREELDRAQDRLPSRTAEKAVEEKVAEYSDRVAGLCAAGFEPAEQEIVWMPKAYLRYRPLSSLPLMERVVYRTLADDLVRAVGDLDEYRDTRDTFESDILKADEKLTRFGIADVASFYRYVPHRLLETRIVEATGRSDLAEAVVTFLRMVMRADVGVPQNVGPSDQFADLLIAPVERKLVRQGLVVSRFNDDFRIGGRSNRAARHGLEALQNELHAYGLTLNDSKTTILRRETFAEHVEAVTEAAYEDQTEIGDEPATQALLRGTKAMLTRALRGTAAKKTASRQLAESQALGQVRKALRRLMRWEDPSAVGHGQAIINRHPSLTQHYGRYCARLIAAGNGDDVRTYLEDVFPRLILTPWQELWLLEPFVQGLAATGPRLQRWLERNVDDAATPPVLRARAMLAAATSGQLSARTALRLIDILPETARPDAIAAYAKVTDSDNGKAKLAALPDTFLAGLIFDDVSRT
jgi:hypothetical protein